MSGTLTFRPFSKRWIYSENFNTISFVLNFTRSVKILLWVTFLAETSKDLEIILITTVLSFTNSLTRTSLYFSLKAKIKADVFRSSLLSLRKRTRAGGETRAKKSVRSPQAMD